MGLSTSELYIVLRARDEASRVMRGFAGEMTHMSDAAIAANQAMYARGQAMATVGVAVAAAGVVGVIALNNMTDAAIAYHQQTAATLTQVDKVNVSFAELHQMGLDVAMTLPVAFEQIQPTLYDIFSSIDTNAPGAALLLRNIGKAAIGGSTDMQVVGRATVAILNAYKMKAQDVTKVNDVMFQLVRKGIGTYAEFTAVIGRAVPSAVKAGQSFEDLAGMMAFLTRNGMSAAMASTSAARALDTLSKPGTIRNLQELGVAVVDSTGKFRPMVDIIADLRVKLENLTPAAQAVALNEIFKGSGANIQSMRFFNLALNDTNGLLNEMTGYLNNAQGAAQEAFDVMSNTPEAQLQQMNNQFKVMEVLLGQQLIPLKLKLASALSAVLQWFNKLSPSAQKWMAIIAAVSAGLLVLVGVMTAVGGVILIVGSSMAMMGITMAGVRAALLALAGGFRAMLVSMGPVGLAIAAVTTVVAIFVGRSDEAKHATEGWTQALYDQNGVLVENHRLIVAKAVSEEGAFDNLNKLGLSERDVTDALLGNYDAMQRVKGVLDPYNAQVAEAARQSGGHAVGMSAQAAQALRVAQAIELLGGDMKDEAMNAAQVRMAMIGTTGATDDLAAANGALDLSIEEVITELERLNKVLSQSQAMDDYRQALRDIDDLIKKNGKTLSENTDKGKLNRDALRDMFSTTADAAQQWGERYGKTTEEIDRKTAKMMKKLRKELIDEGFDPDTVTKMMRGFEIMPAQLRKKAREAAKAADEALAAGMKAAGANGGLALAQGITDQNPAVLGAVNKMTALAIAEARAGFEIQSPSKVFMEIGTNVVEGLIVGMRQKGPELTTLTVTLAKDVVQAYQKAMKDGDADTKKAAKESFIDSVKEAYQEGLGVLKGKLAEARSFAMSWRSQMLGLLNLGTAFSEAQNKDMAEASALKELTKAQDELNKAKASGDEKDISASQTVFDTAQESYRAAAATAATSWIDEWKTQLSQASNFMSLLQQLKDSGAHQMIIDQVAAAGPVAGAAMATDLINGGQGADGLIATFNTQFATFDKSATALGVNFANAWATEVGPKMGGLTAAKTVQAFRREFGPDGEGRKKLMAIMDNLAGDLSRTVDIQVNIKGGNVPGRAAGGPVSANTPYWVGEKGPELFVPGNSGRIIPNGKTPAGGGNQIIQQDITINTQEIDPVKHAADLGWEFASKVRA